MSLHFAQNLEKWVGGPRKTDIVSWEGSWLQRTGRERMAKGRPSFKRGSHHDSIWCCYWGVLPPTYFLWCIVLVWTHHQIWVYLLANVCLWLCLESKLKLLRWASKAWQDRSGFAHSFGMLLWFLGQLPSIPMSQVLPPEASFLAPTQLWSYWMLLTCFCRPCSLLRAASFTIWNKQKWR